ncbi:MAG: LCP family protein [Erysipelotrichaceae bacterium]|jgi:LCP family protein required for cell wall assembly|nr:LCP family protein [Erysipelotrichaceae bacterium]
MKKKKSIWKNSSLYFILVLGLLSVFLMLQLILTPILPNKYIIILGIVLLIINALLIILMFNRRINRFNRILGKIIIVVLSIVLCVGNFYFYKGASTLQRIADANIKTNAISVIVKSDADIKDEADLEELSEGAFGILQTQDRDNTDLAIQDINDKLGTTITIREYNSAFDLAQALYDGEVDAMIFNEAFRGIFTDSEEKTEFKDFDTETKVVYQIELESEQVDISKDVDITKQPFNVYISGIDTYGSVAVTARSDVNMVATVDPVNHRILLTSIPRDYYVAQSCQGGQNDKLTHAGIFGVDCSVSAIENLLNIDINYYVRVNFSSVIQMVDALGGITVNSDHAFCSGLSGGHCFVAGENYLNGEEALVFSRDRYHQVGGDRGRGKNQMKVIEAMIHKAISPAIITNYTGIMNAIDGSFQTNMSSGDITKFIQKQLNEMSGWKIYQNSVDGAGGTDWTPANGFYAYVMYPDQASVDRAKTWINQVMNGQEIVQ